RAAVKVLLFKNTVNGSYTERVDILEEAAVYLKESLEWYRKLTDLTGKTYLYANSMQTPHRKIPVPNGQKYKHWTDCLPVYEDEFNHFAARVNDLKAGKLPMKVTSEETIEPYRQAAFTLLSPYAETYTVQKNSCLFTDGDVFAQSCAEELGGLTGIRFSREEAAKKGIAVEFEINVPARV
ncbi:hypothetical protein K0U00_46655, partial [Paenibacillus sepulcri]|nr:hypothetical protein [Paenibacillus sepulcri]